MNWFMRRELDEHCHRMTIVAMGENVGREVPKVRERIRPIIRPFFSEGYGKGSPSRGKDSECTLITFRKKEGVGLWIFERFGTGLQRAT